MVFLDPKSVWDVSFFVEYRCSQCRLSLPRRSLPKHSFWKHFQMYFKKQLKKFHWIWKIGKKNTLLQTAHGFFWDAVHWRRQALNLRRIFCDQLGWDDGESKCRATRSVCQRTQGLHCMDYGWLCLCDIEKRLKISAFLGLVPNLRCFKTFRPWKLIFWRRQLQL